MTDEKEIKKRRVCLVIEDDGAGKFSFRLEGDTERIGLASIPISQYSAAEYWGAIMLQTMHDKLSASDAVRKLNREERRAQE